MKQQIDPIALAMQILQFVTQRHKQQADIDQNQQRIDLTQQRMDWGRVADERKFGAEELHRKQMLEKIQQQTQAGNMQDLRAMLGDLQNEAMLSQNDLVRLQQIQYEAEQIRQRLREFYQLQPMPQAPVDPKTAQLNAQF